MPTRRPRLPWVAGLAATAVAAGLLTAAPAGAVAGPPVPGNSNLIVAKLNIGDGRRSCSATIIEKQWLASATSCFADNPATGLDVPAGPPKLKTTATVGHADLNQPGSIVVDVAEIVPRTDRDLALVRLASPLPAAAKTIPAFFPKHAPTEGQELEVHGYGRTKDEWVPDQLHSNKFTVGQVNNTSFSLTGKSADAAVCQGDAGGPAALDRIELVGIISQSGQAGCFGSDETQTRRDAVATRVDDIKGWIQSVTSRTLLSRYNWKDAAYTASGRFTDKPAANGKGRMDLFVVWKDGSASIFKAADNDDLQHPFVSEYKIAQPGSIWKDTRAITGARFTDSGIDGLIVRWADGKLSKFEHFDGYDAKNETVLGASGSYWKGARLITSGRYTANSLRDDMLVLWDDGSTTLYHDLGTNGIGKQSQLSPPGWTEAAQISSGEFTGGNTGDLVILWKDGNASLFGSVNASGYSQRLTLRPVGSAWKNAQTLTVGGFSNQNERTNDILIGWAPGALSYYPGVDYAGTHGEIQLAG
ncbi:trypsin-like serine protease [Streptomyces sp. NPDC049577]|uniref:trypsin-like serine protease n=1 Tax=Streptomyces sp. NPDC049577 TaxID=3155153 RepID=UPI0034184C27